MFSASWAVEYVLCCRMFRFPWSVINGKWWSVQDLFNAHEWMPQWAKEIRWFFCSALWNFKLACVFENIFDRKLSPNNHYHCHICCNIILTTSMSISTRNEHIFSDKHRKVYRQMTVITLIAVSNEPATTWSAGKCELLHHTYTSMHILTNTQNYLYIIYILLTISQKPKFNFSNIVLAITD